MNNKKAQSGRSMVEMLGVLAIIGLITIGGISSMGYVDSYFRVNATIIEVDSLAADISDTYSWSRTYDDINLNEMCEEKAIDDCIATGENTFSLQNRWGGDIQIQATNDGASFEIKYLNVPLRACQQIYDASQTPKTFHYVGLTSPTTIEECAEESTLIFKLRD